jgi:hypothetical protein
MDQIEKIKKMDISSLLRFRDNLTMITQQEYKYYIVGETWEYLNLLRDAVIRELKSR